MMKNVIWFNQLGMDDVKTVGGKNASLGEMIQHLSGMGLQVPMGFATTADAYKKFIAQKGLGQKIHRILGDLNVADIDALKQAGAEIRQSIRDTPFLSDFEADLEAAYNKLLTLNQNKDVSVAVRSSATAEDLPDASFAGQQETVLNVSGLSELMQAVKVVFASLFTDRAIAYRVHHGFAHDQVALSAGIQYMVRSDLGGSGVAFSLDTESGFRDVVFITAAYGLGETVVQGEVNPDEYYLYKPNLAANRRAILRKNCGTKAIKMVYAAPEENLNSYVKKVPVEPENQLKFVLNDSELHELAKAIVLIEKHYDRPMDVVWAKDGLDDRLYIVQARPETVTSRVTFGGLMQYILKKTGPVIVEGRSIGQAIGQGTSRLLEDVSEMDKLQPGDVLVTDMTDPDWEPIMKKASAIVTNRGGRTCHAAIVARELGIPAVVGTQDATDRVQDGIDVTVSCAEGDTGYVYEGLLPFEVKQTDIGTMPKIPTKIMLNVANPDYVFSARSVPNHGVGLARLEFIINKMIGVHPNALLSFDRLPDELKNKIEKKVSCYNNPLEFYVEKLCEGISTIAAAFYPNPVIVRTSDFKSNEYANLLGGDLYEPHEENPMLGFRGASRYLDASFRECFKLECLALKKVREELGFTNVWVMIPFTRTVEEGKRVVDLLAENGLKRGENDLKVIMMCEIPSNAVLAEQFLEHFDGFSIGSNDLTQLTLGLDRDSSLVASLFDERNEAVKYFLRLAIQTCNRLGKYIGICGQGPSDYPDLAVWLLEQGIGSMSLNPDSVVKTWLHLAEMTKA
ncbi:MAG: phosphoenolpyruvate synthase [Gammaproteobacteria bacterium]|nr:phosphoenolpyruvate synthase [Gammaproteobacteria bacterium]